METKTPLQKAHEHIETLNGKLDKFIEKHKALADKYAKYNIQLSDARRCTPMNLNKIYNIVEVMDEKTNEELWDYMDYLQDKARKESELADARNRYSRLVEKDLANRVKEHELEEEGKLLEFALGDFKKAYRTRRLEMAITSHRIMWTEKKPKWEKELQEAEALRQSLRNDYEIYTTKAKEYNDLINKIGNLKRCLSCEELRFVELGDYLKVVERHIEDSWRCAIKNLASKTIAQGGISGYALVNVSFNESHIEALFANPKGETLYARLIWAAEYSCLVTPHERYIVTKKTAKK